jgi:integrase
MQRGQTFKRHGSWYVRVYRDELKDGQPVRRRVAVKLAPVGDEYRTARDLRDLVADVVDPVNRIATTPEGSLTLDDFVERFFLPFIASKKKASTEKFYRETYANHIAAPAGFLRLKDVRTQHVQRVLDGCTSLSHASCLRVKTTVSAILSYAIRLGFIDGPNVAREARAEGKKSTFEGHAYGLPDVLWMIERLPEPARTVVGVAAFAGLRESEIRGLQWEDFDGEYLNVRRSVWRQHVGDTKTTESASVVPVIAPLRKMLDAHRKRDGSGPWLFAGLKMGRPLHLDNLSRRVIRPVVGDKWHGWHAFRRGLATNLFTLGVPAEVAQKILRHANVATTQAHYIMLKSQKEGRAAMRKLEATVTRMGNKSGNSSKRNRSRNPRKH